MVLTVFSNLSGLAIPEKAKKVGPGAGLPEEEMLSGELPSALDGVLIAQPKPGTR